MTCSPCTRISPATCSGSGESIFTWINSERKRPQEPALNSLSGVKLMSGAHSVMPYPMVIGNLMLIRKASVSMFIGAPPTMKMFTSPPNDSIIFLRITERKAVFSSGIFIAMLIGPFSSSGSTCLR